jgi:hypothetical protein
MRDVDVVCYAGYRGEEEPRRFVFAGRDLTVIEILDRWLDPAHRYFKVRGSDDGIYLLRHDSESDTWELKILHYGKDPGLP